MKLLTLSMSGFKGMRSLVIRFDGANAMIYGANGTGKSTVYDAFLWLLTGKDARGRTNYDIKPRDMDGNTAPGVEPTVTASVVLEDGRTAELSRRLVEKWSTVRGGIDKEYKGDETKTTIDGVPKSITEYSNFIGEICDETVFALLSNLSYFNGKIENNDRRKLLFDAFGELSDGEVVAKTPALAPLAELLGAYSVEDFKKVKTEERKRLCAELDALPIRMDEAAKQLTDPVDVAAAQAEIDRLNADATPLERELQELRDGLGGQALRQQLSEAKTALNLLENENFLCRKAQLDRLETARKARLAQLDTAFYSAQSALSAVMSGRSQVETQLSLKENQRVKLLADYKSVSAREWSGDASCATCGQPIPAERIAEARGNFNEGKAQKLSELTAQGKALAAEIAKLHADKDVFSARIVAEKASVDTLSAERDKLRGEVFDCEPMAGYEGRRAALEGQAKMLNEQLDTLKRGTTERQDELAARLCELLAQLDVHKTDLLQHAQNEQTEARIVTYAARQNEVVGQLEACGRALFLCEEFTRAKVSAITDGINAHFSMIRFKLFEVQKNGGIKDTCEAVCGGVSYGSLNTASAVAVSLDVINAFSLRYGVSLPIFVDNRESVTVLPPTSAQVISLSVSPADTKLRVETSPQ